jgi:glycosyltransferase involved in cell wall biosynthesis
MSLRKNFNLSKKNLHICHSLELGGITTFVKSLVELNAKSQITHEILVWQKSTNGDYIIDISAKKDQNEVFESVIKEYDQLFVHSLKSFMIPALRKRKKDVYLFQHGLTFGRGFRKIFKQLFYFTAINVFGFKVVCSSEFAKRKLLKNITVFDKRLLKIIPFGVNLNHSSAVSHTSDTLQIGFAGRLVGQKRVQKLFEALQLLECNSKINTKIAGTGPLLEDLKEKALRFNNGDITFQFDGHIKEMSSFFSKLDVLILPSLGESYGLVVLEAFSYNVPVIVFNDTGACVDFIIPNKNGFIVNNTSELSQLICDLNNINLRNQLKLNLKEMDLSNYHISNTKKRLDELSYKK